MQSGTGMAASYLPERCVCSRYGSGKAGRGMEVKAVNSLSQFSLPGGANHHDGKDVWVGREGNSLTHAIAEQARAHGHKI